MAPILKIITRFGVGVDNIELNEAKKRGIVVINARIPVITSGHTSDLIEDQIAELKAISKTGVDAVVLVSNRLDINKEGTLVFLSNLERILEEIPDIDFGIYECPFPSLRLLTNEELKWCADSGRIVFLKDVSCNTDIQGKRACLTKGSNLKLFNANSETLLSSLKSGYVGFNGVMGNFHIDLYRWLCKNFYKKIEKSEILQNKLTEFSALERECYPVNAKYHFLLEGHDIDLYARKMDKHTFTCAQKGMIKDLMEKEASLRRYLQD